MENKPFDDLRKALTELGHLNSLYALLDWDLNVNVPPGGSEARANLVGYVAGLNHSKFISNEFQDILSKAAETEKDGNLTPEEVFIIKKTQSDLEKAKKLPTEFVERSESLYAESHEIWARARAKSDFSLFEPNLVKIVNCQKEKAEYFGYTVSPYDPILDQFEPGITSNDMVKIFRGLKAFLIPFLGDIKASKVKIRKNFLRSGFPLEKQSEFIRTVVGRMGFDFKKGRFDTSVHPFCTGIHPTDVRMTVRYKERDFVNQALLSAIHEAGHGLYEQGLREEYFGTPMAEAVSLGIHESQSRLWENQIGKSLGFWEYIFPELKQKFPNQLEGISFEEFYRAINIVRPGFIRCDADEVNYNLHVILRFELEKDLIEGKLEVRELPRAWNEKMKKYFGLKVPNDSKGVLQDTHWACGLFGYFHTYALGNLYAAQLFSTAQLKIPTLFKELTKNNLLELREWLRENIHRHGEFYLPKDLIMRATGREFTSIYFEHYLSEKYGSIYDL